MANCQLREVELTRHVRTEAGAARYHKPIGTPLGGASRGKTKVTTATKTISRKRAAPGKMSPSIAHKEKVFKYSATNTEYHGTDEKPIPKASAKMVSKVRAEIKQNEITTKLDQLIKAQHEPERRAEMAKVAEQRLAALKTIDGPGTPKSKLAKIITSLPGFKQHFAKLAKSDKLKAAKNAASLKTVVEGFITGVMHSLAGMTVAAIIAGGGLKALGLG